MDDQTWIKRLRADIERAGWTMADPEGDDEKGWIVGAYRFGHGSVTGTGPTGGGATAAEAVEAVYMQVCGDLPYRLRPGETFAHELEGIPGIDIAEFAAIRDEFRAAGRDLVWTHPAPDVWLMHPGGAGRSADEIAVLVVQDTTALKAARRLEAHFHPEPHADR
jgi:hypothetical protein